MKLTLQLHLPICTPCGFLRDIWRRRVALGGGALAQHDTDLRQVLEVGARLDKGHAAQHLGSHGMVVAAQDEVNARHTVGEAAVVGQPHVGEGDDDVHTLQAQLGSCGGAGLDEVGEHDVLGVHCGQRGQPVLLDEPHDADAPAMPLLDQGGDAAAQRLGVCFAQAVREQPREGAGLHSLRQDVLAKVQVVVPRHGHVHADDVQDGHHLLPFRDG